MLSLFTDTLPKPMLAGAFIWAGTHYFVLGPAMGERIVRADYVPACTANVQALAEQAREQRLASLPLPQVDHQAESALRFTETMLSGPLGQWAIGASQGMDQLFGLDVPGSVSQARHQYEAAKRAAAEAYEAARERVKAASAQQIASAGDLCGCIAQAAIEQTRTDWALFTGTLALYTPAPVESFGITMGAVARAGTCEGEEGAAR